MTDQDQPKAKPTCPGCGGRWEYRVVHMHRFLNIEETASIFELDLNKLGQDGWENGRHVRRLCLSQTAAIMRLTPERLREYARKLYAAAICLGDEEARAMAQECKEIATALDGSNRCLVLANQPNQQGK